MTQMMALLCPSLISSLSQDCSFVQFAIQQTLQRDSASMIWIFSSLALFIIVAGVFISGKYSKNFRWFFEKIAAIKKALMSNVPEDLTGQENLDKAIKAAGYAYDSVQDIFYSRIDAWQRNMGYCRLYDEASAPFGMIIDCEPIYFEYDGKKWMIEFWKGQYDLTTGCEIGIYVADGVNANATAYVDSYADSNVDINGNAYADANANINGNAYAEANGNTDTNGNAYAEANADTNVNVYAEANGNTDTNGNAYADANTDTNGNAYADANASADAKTNTNADIDIANTLIGTFYNCAEDADLLVMYFSLSKNQKILFSRKDWHWWLTGFKVGEYSQPSELTMDVSIVFKNETMREAFVQGLFAAGYSEKEIKGSGKEVDFIFDKPKTQQPMTRTKITDEIIQRKNELLCEAYQSITGPYQSFPEKMDAIKRQAPLLYSMILNLGKGEQLLQIYEKINEELKE